MSRAPRILAFGGSLRKASFNHRAVEIAARGAREAGAQVTLIRLRDFPLPLFDEDLEAASGPPEEAKKLKALFIEHDGLLIAAPEYNSSITGALKNVIDWVSRPAPNEPRLAAFQGKVASLLAASPGALGGLRGLVHVRAILSNLGVTVLPAQVTISKAGDAFQEDGMLADARQNEAVLGLGKTLAETTARLKG